MTILSGSDRGLDELAGVFRLLGDKTRLQIVLLLAGGDRNVTTLCQQLSLPQSTVSHHLGLLRISHLIGNRRNGKQVFYTLSGPVLAESQRMMIDTGMFQISIKHGDLQSVAPGDA